MTRRTRGALACAMLFAAGTAHAGPPGPVVAAVGASRAATEFDNFETTAANLLVVLRESPGANKAQEGLQPFGLISTRLPDGREVQFEASWFQWLGDLHVRLVFDGGVRVRSAVPQDLKQIGLSPEQALARALDNLRARYGPPQARPWSGGLMQVGGDAPELNSSYFLDREFWLAQAREHPQGLLVAVPRRGGLVFGPAGDQETLTSLQFTTAALYGESERNRLSSALYLFKEGQWSVYQAPQQPLPR